jgi:hypothetical protein
MRLEVAQAKAERIILVLANRRPDAFAGIACLLESPVCWNRVGKVLRFA